MKKPDSLTRKMINRTLHTQSSSIQNRLPPLKRPADQKSEPVRINCHECQYFYVTWQPSTPYGCKAHGFKSAQIPSMVVFSSSGERCLLFRPKL